MHGWKKNISDFGKDKLRASLLKRDQEGIFSRDLFRDLAQTGFFLIQVPKELGGYGFDFKSQVEAFRILGASSLDIPFTVTCVAQMIAIDLLVKFGSQEQLEQILPDLLGGRKIAAICNSEANAGTDIKSIQSKFLLNSDGRGILMIEKRGATNLTEADYAFCSAQVLEEGVKPLLEVFILPLVPNQQTSHVGQLAGFKTGLTGALKTQIEKAELSAFRLGKPKSGFQILKHCFNQERILIGSTLSGVLTTLVDEGMQFVSGKSSFGKPLQEFQYIQEKIIDIYSAQTRLQALIDSIFTDLPLLPSTHLEGHTKTLSLIKMATIEEVSSSFHRFYEIYGYHAYTLGHVAQKLIRDHLALRFLGGSLEQQKILLFAEIAQDTANRAQIKSNIENTIKAVSQEKEDEEKPTGSA